MVLGLLMIRYRAVCLCVPKLPAFLGGLVLFLLSERVGFVVCFGRKGCVYVLKMP